MGRFKEKKSSIARYVAFAMRYNRDLTLFDSINAEIEHMQNMDKLLAFNMPEFKLMCAAIEQAAKRGNMQCTFIANSRNAEALLFDAGFDVYLAKVPRTICDWFKDRQRYKYTIAWHRQQAAIRRPGYNTVPALRMKGQALAAKLPYELRRAFDNRWPYACVPLLDDKAVKCIKDKGFKYELQATPYCTMCIAELTMDLTDTNIN